MTTQAACPPRRSSFSARDPLRNTLLLTVISSFHASSRIFAAWVDIGLLLRYGEVGRRRSSGTSRPPDSGTCLGMGQGCGTLAVARSPAEGVELRGVSGEAQVASRFAGEWAACRKVVARPLGARRLYEVRSVRDGAVCGRCHWELAGTGTLGAGLRTGTSHLEGEVWSPQTRPWIYCQASYQQGGLLWFCNLIHGCKSIASRFRHR